MARLNEQDRGGRFCVIYHEYSPDKPGTPRESWGSGSLNGGDRIEICRVGPNEYSIATNDGEESESWMPGMRLDDLARLRALIDAVVAAKSGPKPAPGKGIARQTAKHWR